MTRILLRNGVIHSGLATDAVWDRTAFPDLTSPDVAEVTTDCLQTVVDGRTVFEKEGVR